MGIRHIVASSAWITCLLLAVGCRSDDGADHRRSSPLRADTPNQRADTLADLRQDWRKASAMKGREARAAQTRVLNRISSFIRMTEGTEAYGPVCRLWNECYRDLRRRHPDETV